MPHVANKQFFESIIPKQTSLKPWLGQISDALGIDYLTTRYYYLDKRATDLARSRLLHARAHHQKVQYQIETIKAGGLHESNKESG